MPVTVSLRRLNWALGIAVVAIAVLGLISELLLSVYQVDWAFGLVPLLNLSYETNIATWYTSVLLLGCAVALGGVTWARFSQQALYARHWAVLAVAFACLSVNELVRAHEVVNPALADPHILGGLFVLSWVIPLSLLAALFVFAYRGFYAHLAQSFRFWFAIAGGSYVGGGLVTELALNLWYTSHGGSNLVFGLLNLAQGSLQILGASVFFSALIAFVGAEIGELRITVEPSVQKTVQAPVDAETEQKKPRISENPVTGILKLAKYLPRY